MHPDFARFCQFSVRATAPGHNFVSILDAMRCLHGERATTLEATDAEAATVPLFNTMVPTRSLALHAFHRVSAFG